MQYVKRVAWYVDNRGQLCNTSAKCSPSSSSGSCDSPLSASMTSSSSTQFLLELDSPNHLSFFQVNYLPSTLVEFTACNLSCCSACFLRLQIVCRHGTFTPGPGIWPSWFTSSIYKSRQLADINWILIDKDGSLPWFDISKSLSKSSISDLVSTEHSGCAMSFLGLPPILPAARLWRFRLLIPVMLYMAS